MLAFRDPFGIRPLCYGKRKTVFADGVGSDGLDDAFDYMAASESVALDTCGTSGQRFQLERDVAPGEAIFVSFAGILYSQRCHKAPTLTPCLFEYVYFSRPDSIIEGVSVYEARLNMGEKLAKRILTEFAKLAENIDVVMPIPDTSRTSALSCAYGLDRPLREGFIKNRYIARTFIMPGQAMREKTVRLKLNTIKSEFEGKSVLLVDDSIVRGTTSMEIVQMARDAGAKAVYFASAAPPVRFINVYGIDIPTRKELAAYHRSESEIGVHIGADAMIYNTLPDLVASVHALMSKTQNVVTRYEDSCFSGNYVTGVSNDYVASIEESRGKGRTGRTGTSNSTAHDTPDIVAHDSTPSDADALSPGSSECGSPKTIGRKRNLSSSSPLIPRLHPELAAA
jgi:amidophosphoribosyltransferase